MTAIFKREFKSYFHTMTGPVFVAVLLAFTGIFFTAYNLIQGWPYFSAALSSVSIVLLLLVPILTMRSFAEEKRMKTDQLLLTSPVSVTQIVLGKYLSMAAVFGIPCLLMFLGPIMIRIYGGGVFLADSIAVVEFFLMGAAYIAIGMFISSLTENQLIAAVGTFAILLILQLADSMSSLFPSSAVHWKRSRKKESIRLPSKRDLIPWSSAIGKPIIRPIRRDCSTVWIFSEPGCTTRRIPSRRCSSFRSLKNSELCRTPVILKT